MMPFVLYVCPVIILTHTYFYIVHITAFVYSPDLLFVPCINASLTMLVLISRISPSLTTMLASLPTSIDPVCHQYPKSSPHSK